MTWFTTKYFVVGNCLLNAKSDMLLSAWNPPPEWGKYVMLRVDVKQGAPKDGESPIELFQVNIYPLKIHLTKKMNRMLWEYFFPEEEQDSQWRQEAWKVSTTAGLKRAKKGSTVNEASTSSSQSRIKLIMESVGIVKKQYESKTAKTGRSTQEEKKLGKTNDEKKSRPRVMREFVNIKISQVELLVTYEGSGLAVSGLRLLMDTFHCVEFTGTWQGLFLRVKKHITCGVLKSVTGMQGKKFKDKLNGQEKKTTVHRIPTTDLNLSDNDGGPTGSKANLVPITWPPEGGGDGFMTSIRKLFHSQRRTAKAYVLRTMRGEGENDQMGGGGDWSKSDTEYRPFARELTITKERKLIRRYTKKFRAKKGLSRPSL